MNYQTLQVRFETSLDEQIEDICYVRLNRPEAQNAINEQMVVELKTVLARCRDHVKVVVLEGLQDVFSIGADFKQITNERNNAFSPDAMFEVWQGLATGPYVSVAVVKGKANAGGVGFVAASDIVIADKSATFGLSELLFGLMPAMVLPFLVRKIGFQRSHAMTLMTKPVSSEQASEWGLIDVLVSECDTALKQQMLRFRCLNKKAIIRYKEYATVLAGSFEQLKPVAIAKNRQVFEDEENIEKISRYVHEGKFPWEPD